MSGQDAPITVHVTDGPNARGMASFEAVWIDDDGLTHIKTFRANLDLYVKLHRTLGRTVVVK